MHRTSLHRVLPWAALITVWFVWGSTYLGIRVAVETIPPFLMAGIRYIIAGGLMTAVMLVWRRDLWRDLRAPQWRSLTLNAFLLLVVGNGLLCYAEEQIPSGIAAIVVATVPIWMVVISAVVTRTRVALGAAIGLVLGMLGIIGLMGIPGAGIPLVPTVLVLIGSFSWALGSVYARQHADLRANALIPSLEMFVGGVMLSIVGIVTGESSQMHLAAISTPSILGFVWLVTAGAIVGYTAYTYAVRTLPTQVVATYAYINPIVAVALGVWILREPVTLNVLVGGAAIVLAVVAILKSPLKRQESDALAQETEIAAA